MDFDRASYKRQTANIHATPKAGAFRLKQRVTVTNRQNPPEYEYGEKVEAIQEPQARHQQAGQGRKRGGVEAKASPFQKPGERRVGALATKEQAIEKTHVCRSALRSEERR